MHLHRRHGFALVVPVRSDFALFRKHCRADDFDDETEYLRDLLEAAEETIIRATNRTAAELVEIGGGSLPKSLQIAAFTIGAHWYNKRKTMNAARKSEHDTPPRPRIYGGFEVARPCAHT